MEELKLEAIKLLVELIKQPSISGQETGTADILASYLNDKNVPFERIKNNLIVKNKRFDLKKKTIVLNSHHDTVKPNSTWTYDPFGAIKKDGKIIGLGSNDAGASLVSLLATFLYFFEQELDYNLVLILVAEEENFGPNGIKLVLNKIDFPIHLAIVGEPTEMKMAVSEKGLLVIDGVAKGVAGHAARPNGHNAIDIAMNDIQKINNYQFDRVSNMLGPVVKSVTQIEAGYQHNIIPDHCDFVIDVRVNEYYNLEDVFETLQELCDAQLKARSFSNKPSSISIDHEIVQLGIYLGIETFGSPTLSDQVNIPCNSIKIGPGISSRSHQADEFVFISEIKNGVDLYINLISNFIKASE